MKYELGTGLQRDGITFLNIENASRRCVIALYCTLEWGGYLFSKQC